MPSDTQKLHDSLKKKDKEIVELKELLAEAEAEIKELNDFHGFQKPKVSILESRFLNKMIKTSAFLLVCALVVMIGIYPWVFKDEAISDGGKDNTVEVVENTDNIDNNDNNLQNNNADTNSIGTEEKKDVKPVQMLIVKSDLGWLNVRTEPNIETGAIIKKINSEEEYEWLEKTDDNWYKVKIDSEGHTGFVSGEYVELK